MMYNNENSGKFLRISGDIFSKW